MAAWRGIVVTDKLYKCPRCGHKDLLIGTSVHRFTDLYDAEGTYLEAEPRGIVRGCFLVRCVKCGKGVRISTLLKRRQEPTAERLKR